MKRPSSLLSAGSLASLALACSPGTASDNKWEIPDARSDGTIVDTDACLACIDTGPGRDVAITDLAISPADVTLVYDDSAAPPSQQFTVTANGNAVSSGVTFRVDRGELASISASGLLTVKAGTFGGKLIVAAEYAGKIAKANVTVDVRSTQNGGSPTGDAGVDAGAGGAGGVGGHGEGPAVSPATKAALDGTPTADASLTMLYPYNGTVWPRGVLAPLLQWKSTGRNFDGVRISLKSARYSYVGYFGKNATNFVDHPIPQEAWKRLSYSSGGEDIEVELVLSEGATAYGPIKHKWKVVPATLKGTVYYQSYGTKLAHQYTNGLPNNTPFGGATLAIRKDSVDPTLVAGGNGGEGQCRVCHSVAMDGSRLVTQHGDNYFRSSLYDLKTKSEQLFPYTSTAHGLGQYGWSALYPDGSLLLTNAPRTLSGSRDTSDPSQIYDLPSGQLRSTPAMTAAMLTPSFSPDGKWIAFNYYAGQGADKKSLYIIDFDKTGPTFGTPRQIYSPAANEKSPFPGGSIAAYWPSFVPQMAGSPWIGVVFHKELRPVSRPDGKEIAGTRSDLEGTLGTDATGARAELWYAAFNTATGETRAVRLDRLNGRDPSDLDASGKPKLYVPTGPFAHDDDSTLNYEPTVSPIVAGGYAWVVFTSRRLYGNVATINPYWSDPRYYDLTKTPTTKKLWVAAINLNAKAGDDPSFPAFYMPAQELLAGNTRGYWVVDPCKPNGNSCETGDECCGGFCRQEGDAGGIVCTEAIPNSCSNEFEKCQTAADCCAPEPGSGTPAMDCINGRCGYGAPPPPK